MDAEVIVAGGGPAGSATALLLARHGHDILLLDRARFPRHKACAEYLSPATADALDRLGALAAVERHAPERPRGMEMHVGGRAQALVTYPQGTAERRALCVTRYDLDYVLLQCAIAAGVQVHQAHQVVDARIDRGSATVTVRAVEAAPSVTHMLRAQVLVGADGARSLVARRLAGERPVVWPRRIGLVGRFRGVGGAAALRDYGEMHVGQSVYCGLAPLPGGLVNVACVLSLPAARRAGGTASVWRHAMAHLPAVAAKLDGATLEGPLQGVAPLARRVARAAGDGFLLVGDAAGFLDPFTGEGVFRALRGAELAAETLHQALRRGQFQATDAAAYSRRRREEFGPKEALCWVIQGMLFAPPVLAYALRRMSRRASVAAVLGGVLGDLRPASEALHPSFLWSLLRP